MHGGHQIPEFSNELHGIKIIKFSYINCYFVFSRGVPPLPLNCGKQGEDFVSSHIFLSIPYIW